MNQNTRAWAVSASMKLSTAPESTSAHCGAIQQGSPEHGVRPGLEGAGSAHHTWHALVRIRGALSWGSPRPTSCTGPGHGDFLCQSSCARGGQLAEYGRTLHSRNTAHGATWRRALSGYMGLRSGLKTSTEGHWPGGNTDPLLSSHCSLSLLLNAYDKVDKGI